MPLYDYRCPDCGVQFERYEPMSDSHEFAICECGQSADRIYAPSLVYVDNTQPHFNHGLGVKVNSRKDIREFQRAYKDRTGSELVEVGNERIPTRNAPLRTEYETPRQLGV